MKRLILLSALLIFAFSYGQTPITDSNLSQAIETCLSTNNSDGMCSDSEYGAMPNWDVSNVTDMDSMFQYIDAFNQPIGNWDVSNVTTMFTMFESATSFNQPIGNWDVSNVTNMYAMLADTPFNQPIGNWDVSNVTTMRVMFAFNYAINQDLSTWSVDNVNDCTNFSNNTPQWTLPKPNFTNCFP